MVWVCGLAFLACAARPLAVTLPEGVRGWQLTPVVGTFRPEGAELMPEYLRAAAALGLKCAQSDPQTWTDETLKGKKLVVLAESNSNAFFKSPDQRKPFWEMIDRYVRAGGSVLLINAMGWLAHKPVDAKIRRDFRSNLFLTESDFKAIAAEEK